MSDFPNGYLNPTYTGDAGAATKPLINGAIIGITPVVVKEDACGYPYIPVIELYDYDNDVPLAKKGDKVKVIIIKEE